MPSGASLLLLPAGSGTFMLLDYSGGLFPMHNVEAGFPRLCLGKLDLSNTLDPGKTLSFSKPPHVKKQLCCFPTVLDGIRLPGKGVEEPFRVPSTTVPRGSVQFRQKGRYPGPRRPGSYLTGP